MGLFWDLYQQSQISEHRDRATSLEGRVRDLESQLDSQAKLLSEVIRRLEVHLKADLNSDGRVG
jgi:hypothetical protein